jgi:endonuclease-3|tara:strand:+ start:240 stop:863 length:624 start_codon:yes stop_codon:yes gene_type:complete
MDSKLAMRQLKALGKLTEGRDIRLAAEWDEPWQVLIATILSAQTRDVRTIKICDVLFRKYDSIEKLARARLSSIEKVIRSINYYKTKARHIRETAKIVSRGGRGSVVGGRIGESVEELMRLPGVGRKVANVYLVQVHNAAAIGVDTHVARISQKLGWSKNKDPHKIEKDLMELFPRKYWNSINYIVVRFGQTFGRSGKVEDGILKDL